MKGHEEMLLEKGPFKSNEPLYVILRLADHVTVPLDSALLEDMQARQTDYQINNGNAVSAS